MLQERRQNLRKRVLRRGRIVLRGGYSTIDCVVLDMSAGGARLRVGDWLPVPRVFELRIENGPSRQAEVCFRSLDLTGVRFIDDKAA